MVSFPPTLLRCVKMTQQIPSYPVQKQSRNCPCPQRFENWRRVKISNQNLAQLPISLEERSVAAVVEAKNKKNSLGANRWTEQINCNYANPPFRFIKEEADAGTKAKPNKVEKEKQETEKTAAPSKVNEDLLGIPKNNSKQGSIMLCLPRQSIKLTTQEKKIGLILDMFMDRWAHLKDC